jgi:hypothetical protein
LQGAGAEGGGDGVRGLERERATAVLYRGQVNREKIYAECLQRLKNALEGV